MKKFKVLFLLLGVFLILTGFIFNRFLIYGSEKIPAYMLSQAQVLHPEITLEQRKNAERFFGRFPFVFRWCFDRFINNGKEEPGDLKSECVLFLPAKNPPWMLKYLFKFLKSSDPEIRMGAAEGLQLCLSKFTLLPWVRDEVFSKLTEAWVKEKELKVYTQLAIALSGYGGSAIEVFRGLVNDSDNKKRIIATLSLYALTGNFADLKVLRKIFDVSDVQDKRLLVVNAYMLFKDKLKPVWRWGLNGKDPKTKEMIFKLLKQGHL